MLREEDIVTALMAQTGQERIRDKSGDDGSEGSLDSIFHDLAKYSHMIDWGDQKKRGGSCGGAGRGSERRTGSGTSGKNKEARRETGNREGGGTHPQSMGRRGAFDQ